MERRAHTGPKREGKAEQERETVGAGWADWAAGKRERTGLSAAGLGRRLGLSRWAEMGWALV